MLCPKQESPLKRASIDPALTLNGFQMQLAEQKPSLFPESLVFHAHQKHLTQGLFAGIIQACKFFITSC